MPAKSQAQRAYLNSEFGHEWVKKHHFDNAGKLPARVKGKAVKHKKHKGKKAKVKGFAKSATRRLNGGTAECGPGACHPTAYFKGTNEHEYK